MSAPTPHRLGDYWRVVHASTRDDLAAVNYPNLPPSYNRFVDRVFESALLSALAGIAPGRALEVGCGRGRWLRRLAARGWEVCGADLALATRPTVAASACTLPFRAGSFDLALAITVLQHLHEKEAALAEATRVVRNGGHFLLVEILDREGVRWQEHVIPWSAARWREEIRRQGWEIEAEMGVEHNPIMIAIESLRSRRGGGAAAPDSSTRPSLAKRSAWSVIAWAARLTEPMARRFAPSTATHRLFLCRKIDS